MSLSVGLAKITGDPDATRRTDRALRRLGEPGNVVDQDVVWLNSNGQLTARPGRSITPYRAVTGATTITTSDWLIHATAGGPFTQALPTAVGIGGRVYVLKNNSGGTITVDPAGAETVDGAATAAVLNGASIRLQSTNLVWISW